jgi:two-component system, cell cycle response regulator
MTKMAMAAGMRERAPTSLPGSPAEEPSRDQDPARGADDRRNVESRSFLRVVLGVAGLAAVAFAILAIAGAGRSPVGTACFYIVLFGVSSATLLRGVLVREERLPWMLLGAGLLAWSAGFLYWRVRYADADSQPIPSLSDVLELSFYPVACAAIVTLARRRLQFASSSVFLDGAAAALATGCIGVLILAPPLAGVTEGELRVVLTGLAYPVGDVLLVGLCVGLLAVRGAQLGPTWLLILAGGLVFAATDTLSLWQSVEGSYTPGGPLDIGWMLGVLLIGLPAWRPIEARRVVDEGHHSVVLPTALGAVSLGVLTVDHFDRLPVAAILAASLSLAVILRRFVVTFALSRRLIAGSEREALTDTVTTLANRRALMLDLDAALSAPAHVLAIFDLDGFKHYNDTFGHPAGDLLLIRLSERLRDAAAEHGASAYRMGGDEFCVLGAAIAGPGPKRVLAWGNAALTEHGEGFTITASGGAVVVDETITDASAALSDADERMYGSKRSRRNSALAQTTAVLRSVQEAVDGELARHTSQVAILADRVARHMGLSEPEIRWIRCAAELHDVGKVAIPAGIMHKRETLDPQEWAFIRRHTLIGEHIAESASALSPIAPIIRSSHERWDGGGYPDGLAGDEIPVGAQIVFVCDAFDAMTSDRAYRAALPAAFALRELREAAGTQFSPRVVEAFIAGWTGASLVVGVQQEPGCVEDAAVA